MPALRAAVEREPEVPDSWHTLGHIQRKCWRLGDARDSLSRAVALGEVAAAPEWIESLIELGDLDGAQRTLAELPVVDPTARGWLAAKCAFLTGNLRTGWAHYESRLEVASVIGLAEIPASARRWRGEPLLGRSVAVITEQGFGDIIQFARFARPLAEQGAYVRFVLRPATRSLAPLLLEVEGISAVEIGPAVSSADVHVPLLSIPHHLETSIDSIPSGTFRRLTTGRDRIQLPPLLQSRAFNIGLVWAGDPNHTNDFRRSATLQAALQLAAVPGTRLFSLQVGPRAADLRGYEALVTDLGSRLADWRQTASALLALDLVITVDTAVAHLAGALERPVWVALPYAPDWRWLLNRDDSPWYPTMRLFRQSTAGDWETVFARMCVELVGLRARGWAV